jgi:hypothetical protein
LQGEGVGDQGTVDEAWQDGEGGSGGMVTIMCLGCWRDT